ncbi:MAG: type II toxin-antitoxin system VapC family toxin [Nitrososphaeria archaeon]
MKIFLDTSALVAYYNADDRYHNEAFEIMEKIKRGVIPLTRFYITDYILDETLTFIECVIGAHDLAIKVGESLQTSPFTTIVRIDDEVFNDAWNMFKKSKGYSFTDCTSFTIMKKYGVTHAFTFDKHFGEAGFMSIP